MSTIDNINNFLKDPYNKIYRDFHLEKTLSMLRHSKTQGEFYAILRQSRSFGFSNREVLDRLERHIKSKFGV